MRAATQPDTGMAKENTLRRRIIAFGVTVLAALAVTAPLALLRPVPAAAQFFPFFGPFQPPPEAPKPPADYSRAPAPKKPETPPTTTVVILGDSMADWLAYGLEDAFADSPEIGIVRKHRAYSGLIRYEAKSDLDWPHVAKDILNTEKPAAIVMLLGLSDRQALRDKPGAKGANPAEGQEQPPADAESPDLKIMAPEAPRSANGSIEFRSDQWADAYAKKVDEMMTALKSKGIPVIWVGLPPVRGPKAMSDTAYLNDIYRVRAEKAGIIYVDVWDGFVDETGKFSTYGPDVEGQTRSLRAPDGVFFTNFGARKLAHYVERELSRVMVARSTPFSFPSDDGVQSGSPAARPVAGPILPLTATTVSTSEQLLGGSNNSARPNSPEPASSRVLVKGEPVAPLKGRADDFVWPLPGASASVQPPSDKAPDMQPAPTPPAGAKDGKKPAAAGKQTKQESPAAEGDASQTPAAPAPKKPPPAPREAQRPPAPNFNPFGGLFR